MVRSQPSFRGGRFASSRGSRGGDRGGRGGDWGGRGGGGRGGRSFGRGRGGGRPSGPKVWVVNHRFPGIFMTRGQLDAMVTLNLAPGEKVYQEKLVPIQNEAGEKIEYRVWNPYKSKIAAALLGGVDLFGIAPGVKVLYLGAASGTTVSHVADIVGLEGGVYAVEFSQRSGRDLVNMAKKRPNVIPIIEDARQPQKYRMIVPCVDVLFADVAQPDQARILGLNAEQFLKRGGMFMISIKANCVDSTKDPNLVFKEQIEVLKSLNFIPKEMVTLDPYEIGHAVVTGYYQVEQ